MTSHEVSVTAAKKYIVALLSIMDVYEIKSAKKLKAAISGRKTIRDRKERDH